MEYNQLSTEIEHFLFVCHFRKIKLSNPEYRESFDLGHFAETITM